jgi:hypothetical protein
LAGSTTTVTSAPSSTSTTSATGTTSASGAADPSVSVDALPASDQGALANTGLPVGTVWIAALGLVLLLIGAVGRGMSVRARR